MPKKSRFENIETQIEKVTHKAAMHETKPKPKNKNMLIYNIPEEITHKSKKPASASPLLLKWLLLKNSNSTLKGLC